MGTAQIVLIVIASINMLLSANEHGRPRKNHNFWTDFIGVVLLFSILIWGGFFE